MVEHVSDSQPPCIRVVVPGGRDLPGRITGWRQDETGAWWARTELYVPAGAVQQVPGEDYAGVPREPAQRYVLVTDTRVEPPTSELHLASCWTIREPAQWQRFTPLIDGIDGPEMLRFDDTVRCPICHDPDAGAPR